MKRVTRNEVYFSEIFYYARDKFNVDWNRANDMFFDNSLNYQSYNTYELNEPLEYIEEDKPFEELSEEDKGYYIINQFMIDNNVNSIWIDNS